MLNPDVNVLVVRLQGAVRKKNTTKIRQIQFEMRLLLYNRFKPKIWLQDVFPS